jgi:type III secretion system FlhB-like substrate exporter
MAEAVHIREARQVAQRYRLVRQQRAGQQRESRILGAGNGKAARQAIATANDDAIHLPRNNGLSQGRKGSKLHGGSLGSSHLRQSLIGR